MSSLSWMPSSLPQHNVATKRAHRIWEISELLEQILIHLRMRDLLLDQRVCHLWHEIISSSPTLQTTLFLRPDIRNSASAISDGRTKTMPNCNPLLIQSFTPLFQGCLRMAQHTWATTSHQRAVLQRNASWRHMLVAQPPHGTLEEVIAYIGEDGLVDHTDIRTSPILNGLHMGYIYDKAELILRSQSETYLVVLLGDWVLQGLTGIQHVDETGQEMECREWTRICRSAVGRGKWSGSDRITFYIEKPLVPHMDEPFPGDDASGSDF